MRSGLMVLMTFFSLGTHEGLVVASRLAYTCVMQANDGTRTREFGIRV